MSESPSMDREEVDIGTIRNSGASSLPSLPLHIEPRLSLPSSPNIEVSSSSSVGLSRAKTLPHARRKSGLTLGEFPTLDADKISRIRRWISLDFDLDIGPVLHALYPPLELSAAYRENIAFSSFPDTSTFETGSQVHSFKLAGPGTEDSDTISSADGFVYGYAFFAQRRDLTSKRGYLQRSITILSKHPFPSLFEELVSILAPLYLSHGSPNVLESACQDISTWPDPAPGSTLELGFLGSVLQAQIPRTHDELQFAQELSLDGGLSPRLQILASVPSWNPTPLSVLSAILPSLWSVWELLMLCEPILVFSTSPRITSLAVWWFRDFIRPLSSAGDFRPYITIQDKDYTSLINKAPPNAGLVVGVTNPFLLSMTKHWPHVLSLAYDNMKQDMKPPSKTSKTKHLPRKLPGSGPPPGFVSKTHKRFTSKDRHLLKTWEEALHKGGSIESSASQQLRRHFSSRTASFLAPLNRYLNTLIPSPAEAAGHSAGPLHIKPRLKVFNSTQFLMSLKTHGSPLPFKSSTKQRDFYERWLRTPAFALWLANQEEIVSGVLNDARQTRN